jgi:DsbC/DsbD-like thiol-disulfide interchange protein
MGLKPQFNFDGSLNIDSLNVLWPSPKVFGSSGFESIGYENEVILPIIIKAKVISDPIYLKIKGIIGICFDVCVPIEFETQSELKIVSKDINTDLLAALANLPLSPSDIDKNRATCTITFGPTGFKIEANIPYLETESSNIFFSIKGYQEAVSIEQPKQFTPGKIISAIGEWFDKPTVKINSDLITITQLDEGQVVEQNGC